MKPPRLSVRTIMTALVVVAIDCVVYRSFATRPAHMATDDFEIVLATLPMANLLAVVIARLAGSQARPFWVGFSIGGLGALLGTILGLEPALDWLCNFLASTGPGRWLDSSPIGALIGDFAILGVLPLLFQLLIALTVGMLARKVGGPVPPGAVARPRAGKPAFRSLLVLLILAALPILVIETSLRRQIDPQTVRHPSGLTATVAFREIDRFTIPKSSPILLLEGNKVRIESDQEPSALELLANDTGKLINDHRSVRVTLLDGERAGQSIDLPYCSLRPVRLK